MLLTDLDDVNPVNKSNGRMIQWDASSNKHIYVIPPLTIGESLPTAAATYRGKFFLIIGVAFETPDKLYICMKLSNETYDWIQIT
ncbi:hypothetical protein B1A99_03210 [Cohnella sp. CIP 111063]|jgi:hypothetical protein|uniref:hypothetical protein n=1 Tax=unclassified Cohnella TaxID=2636738 RepID=UPI000B8C046B|nr:MULTISPECIES: hypothetical protein [unclassified Cohnella]OXS61640.1 hypothetical protein B1A99_03210 [Cohnella sp. CIP 111063]PRX74058.1 hypothetical protein B0G52_10283 [Cohnella sp. SGD-V74]